MIVVGRVPSLLSNGSENQKSEKNLQKNNFPSDCLGEARTIKALQKTPFFFLIFFDFSACTTSEKVLSCPPAFASDMSDLSSQTIEEAPASFSWTAKHRIGGVWKSSEPVEFAIAPISAVTVRANALTVSAMVAAAALAFVNLNAATQVVAEKKQAAAFGIICRECR